MKDTKQKTYRTKHFNVVTNTHHGACLLFDRKGQGISQSQKRSNHQLAAKNRFITESLNKISLSFRTHVRNLVIT